MSKDIIYLKLRGRIGNQLFQYAYAKWVQSKREDNPKIIIDDAGCIAVDWKNNLPDYDLENVEFVHDAGCLYQYIGFFQKVLLKLHYVYREKHDYNDLFEYEKKYQKLYNQNGLILCENGYIDTTIRKKGNIYIEGYFQSTRFFEDIKSDIDKCFDLSEKLEQCNYPGLDEIKNRNTVCVSIKVEHNVGNEMYDVCNNGYYSRAIDYIVNKVDNPLFFVCSDNVEYVKEHLIDCSKYDVICQAKGYPVELSLAAMSKAKHFIIGNTTFAWWAQYLSAYEDKIVIAPSRWMNIDMPIDICQDSWTRIEV